MSRVRNSNGDADPMVALKLGAPATPGPSNDGVVEVTTHGFVAWRTSHGRLFDAVVVDGWTVVPPRSSE
jgi:hypothetical protein